MKSAKFAMLALLAAMGCAAAQPQSLRIVVPNPPGGAMDTLMRLLAERIGRLNNIPVIVDNRAGASTIIGSEIVARAAPDGATVLVAANSFVINPHLRQLSFDPLTSFEPVCHVADVPQAIAVHGKSPYKSLADLIADARRRPGELSIGSNGPTTAQHIVAEKFRRDAKVDMLYVPFPGGPPAVNAIMGQHMTAIASAYPELQSHVQSGDLRVLATTAGKRVPALPDLPTLVEAGIDLDMPSWLMVLAPAKTPAPAMTRLRDWFREAVMAPEVAPRLAPLLLTPVGACGPGVADYLRAQHEAMGKIVREANIKVQD